MVTRTEKGTLVLNSAKLDLFMDELFTICETEEDVQWIFEELVESIDSKSQERITELE